MMKKNLKARDIERLENTSFVAPAGDVQPDPPPVPVLADTCSCDCETCLCCFPNQDPSWDCCDVLPPHTAIITANTVNVGLVRQV